MTEAISMRLPRGARVDGCHGLADTDVRRPAGARLEHVRYRGR